MAKDPAVLLYTSDFLSGTYTMTNEQIGKYIKLLCLQHQKDGLSETELNSISENDKLVMEKFTLIEGRYYNERMRDEAIKRKEYSESRRKNRTKKENLDINQISKSYDKHMNNISSTYVEHMEDVNVNVNDNINDNSIATTTNTGVINKILNNLIQLSDSTKHFQAVEDLEEIGGIDYITDVLRWSDSVKNNWNQKIFSANQIHAGIFPK